VSYDMHTKRRVCQRNGVDRVYRSADIRAPHCLVSPPGGSLPPYRARGGWCPVE
jgi:hypothetical protein